MFKKIKNLIVAAILPLTVAAPMLIAAPVAADTLVPSCANNINNSLKAGVNSATGNSGSCSTANDSGQSLQGLASKIVNILSVIVGIVAVIMIIVGGFRYITSGGDSGKVGGAKNTLIYAIVGLIIVALAQFIVHFVLNNVPGNS